MHALFLFMVTHNLSKAFLIAFHFLYFCSSNCVISITCPLAVQFSLLLVQICCWNSLLNYSVNPCYIPQLQSFCLVLLYIFFYISSTSYFFLIFFSCYAKLFIHVSYSSLSVYRTIILNSLLGNFGISISLGPITGGLLHSFGGAIFPDFHDPCSLV